MESGSEEPLRQKAQEFRQLLEDWYLREGDSQLPWRAGGGRWGVLLAAFLLRKTTTAQVAQIYGELLKRYPSPSLLAQAREEELEELIRPLGIEHQRARQLKRLAQALAGGFGGEVPCREEDLLSLPGVGRYIASEVLLSACGQPRPLLDRNMIRVVERVFSVKSKKRRPHEDPELWAFAAQLVPQDSERAKAFNYAVLDFARKVCTARKPKCSACPLRGICNFARSRSG